MHIDPYIVLGSAVVGFLVGMTGAGGGALMTPMLILLFGVTPSHAISSDLVAAVVMRPVGASVHLRKGTVNRKLVGWLVLGSVPMAFLGAYLLHIIGNSKSAQTNVETVLGVALLVGAAAMVLRYTLDLRSGEGRYSFIQDIVPRPVRTVLIGMIGGVVVGMTSVGSGSLMIILMLFLYPTIGANQLVGTDLTQAVPLTAAAALGAARLRARRIRRHPLADHRQRPRGVRRLAVLLDRARSLHPARDHLRDLRLGAEVRRPRDRSPRLGPVRDAAGRRGHMARGQAPVGDAGGLRQTCRRAGPGRDARRPRDRRVARSAGGD